MKKLFFASVITILSSLAALSSIESIPATVAQNTRVVINNKELTRKEVDAVSQSLGIAPQPGNYWYDSTSGAFGYHCGPTAAFLKAGLRLGGSLKANASCGNTEVFINGREIHRQEYVNLESLVGYISPGDYWVDANGNAGKERGRAIVNLRQVAAQALDAHSRINREPFGTTGVNSNCSYFSNPNGLSVGC